MRLQSKKYYLIEVIFCIFFLAGDFDSHSQDNKELDSLKNVLKSERSSEIKAEINLKIGNSLLSVKPEESRLYAIAGLGLGKKSKNPSLLTDLWGVIGSSYFYEGEWAKSLNAYKKSLQFAIKNKARKEEAIARSNIGLVHMRTSNYVEAQKEFISSLAVREEIKDIKGEVNVLSNLGTLYSLMNNGEKEFYYNQEAYKRALKTGDKLKIANTLNNLGGTYYNKGKPVNALEYFKKAIKIFIEENEVYSLASTYSNTGMLLIELKRYDEAEKDLNEGLRLKRELGDLSGEGTLLAQLASFYCEKGDFEKGLDHYKEAEKIFIKGNEPSNLQYIYKSLAEEHKKRGNANEAYKYLLKYDELRDTLLSESQARAVEEMATKYETTKKEKEIRLQKQNLKIKNELLKSKQVELESEKYFKNSIIVGLCLAILLAFVIARSLYINKRKNRLITKQKQIVEEQKQFIEEKSKEITDSINYAQRIQQAILPPPELLSQIITDNFIFYQPKDVVSGDFYQLYQLDNEIIVVTADCTGHGVPGAFMSMIGNEQLGKIIMERGITQPAAILDALHLGIRKALKQDRSDIETRDGMDLALYKLNYKTLELEYAGANRPLWILENGKINEIKANKQPIGGIQSESRTSFTNHSVKLRNGNILFSFTDGFIDQFGGEKGKKYMLKKFGQFLETIGSKPMSQQHNDLIKEFNDWKGNREQIDDILVIGVKV
jgi:serine phosphatase RsbU (regulator of sigma subunit)/Tfp pilus assembly protein PilF